MCCRHHIHRQPSATFHEGSWVPAMRQFTICAARIPMTIVNWLSVTNLPLIAAGATSAMYIGLRHDAMPMAIPPMKRAVKNGAKLLNAPVPIEDTTKMKADRIKSGLRPYRSAREPAVSAPSIHPASAMLVARPIRRLFPTRPKYS